MKWLLSLVIGCIFPFVCDAQLDIDSLKKELSKSANDSIKYNNYHQLYIQYEEIQKDSALLIAKKMFELAQKNNQSLSAITCMGMIGYQQMGLGDYSSSINILLKALELSEERESKSKNSWSIESGTISNNYDKKHDRSITEAHINHILGNLMFNTGNFRQSEIYFRKARAIGIEIGYIIRWGMGSMNLGRCFIQSNKLDSAIILEKEADSIAQLSLSRKYLANIYTYFGDIAQLKNQQSSAHNFYTKAIQYGIQYRNFNGLVQAYSAISKYFLNIKNADSSLFYSNISLKTIESLGSSFALIYVNKGTIYQNIYECYLQKNIKDSIEKYHIIALEQKDSISKVRIKTLTEFQNTLFQNQIRLQALEKEKILIDNKNRSILFISGIVLVLVVTTLLYRNNRIKQKDNAILKKAFIDLKSTQSQLIQSEKMASLGELTAGIAHEIQNPLNFVNNFSEVSAEMVKEMVEEVEKGNNEEVKAIAADVQQNLEKINHHGKRAADIVKGMLQHSRNSNGIKEPTDINALCDEYLRLSYHGLRAKDKNFNATLKTNFDENIGSINIIPQDIGRVLLNLMNNAFYVVNEKLVAQKGSQESNIYQPTVTVSTRKTNTKVEIAVADNGNGIPQHIIDKIFQPFFTTKPSGQGTGLGLSLSYDIVKAHGGELKVETEQGVGTTFTIQIPI